MITLDTSALFALLNRKDVDHKRVASALLDDPGPYLVPAGILAEIAYLTERRLGLGALEALLQDLESEALAMEWNQRDLPRIRELVVRYKDLPLGVADASVIAVAERNGGRVLSLDRHFHVVAQEGTIHVLP
ncbi:MAG: PIN domain-containing protein [Meiothermus silvanus]|nr:PIN domain-containing protein [Allomeiothermus silvanus]